MSVIIGREIFFATFGCVYVERGKSAFVMASDDFLGYTLYVYVEHCFIDASYCFFIGI